MNCLSGSTFCLPYSGVNSWSRAAISESSAGSSTGSRAAIAGHSGAIAGSSAAIVGDYCYFYKINIHNCYN